MGEGLSIWHMFSKLTLLVIISSPEKERLAGFYKGHTLW